MRRLFILLVAFFCAAVVRGYDDDMSAISTPSANVDDGSLMLPGTGPGSGAGGAIYELPLALSGADQLPSSLTFDNGATATPILCTGENSNASTWTCTGATLTQTGGGTALLANQRSLFNDGTKEVRFGQGEYFAETDTSIGNIGTKDFVILYSAKTVAENKHILHKLSGSTGWRARHSVATGEATFDVGSVSVGCSDATESYKNFMVMFDRSDKGVCFNNATPDTAIDISTQSGDMDNAVEMAVGGASAAPGSPRIAIFGLYIFDTDIPSNTTDTDSDGITDWQEVATEYHQRLSGFWPTRGIVKPWTSFTRATAAILDMQQSCILPREQFIVGPGWSRLVQFCSGASLITGGLMEQIHINLVTYNEASDNAAWSKINVTVDPDTETGPGLTVKADSIVETTANAVHCATQTIAHTNTDEMVYSEIVSAATRTWVHLVANDSSTTFSSYFDLDNCVAGTTANTDDEGCIDYGNGWRRIWIAYTAGATGSGYVGVCGATGDTVDSYVGVAIDSFHRAGAQEEVSTSLHSPTTIANTEGATVQVNADVLLMDGDNLGCSGSCKKGTIVAQFWCPSADVLAQAHLIGISDGGSAAQFIGSFVASNELLFAQSVAGAANFLINTTGSVADGATHTSQLTYEIGEAVLYKDISTTASAAPADIPDDLDRIYIGASFAGSSQSGCILQAFTLYNRIKTP